MVSFSSQWSHLRCSTGPCAAPMRISGQPVHQLVFVALLEVFLRFFRVRRRLPCALKVASRPERPHPWLKPWAIAVVDTMAYLDHLCHPCYHHQPEFLESLVYSWAQMAHFYQDCSMPHKSPWFFADLRGQDLELSSWSESRLTSQSYC